MIFSLFRAKKGSYSERMYKSVLEKCIFIDLFTVTQTEKIRKTKAVPCTYSGSEFCRICPHSVEKSKELNDYSSELTKTLKPHSS